MKISKESQGNVRILGNVLNDKWGSGLSGNVYDSNYYAPTILTMNGGHKQPHIIVKKIKEL